MTVIITIIIVIIIIISSGGDKQLHLNNTGGSVFIATMKIGAVSECRAYPGSGSPNGLHSVEHLGLLKRKSSHRITALVLEPVYLGTARYFQCPPSLP